MDVLLALDRQLFVLLFASYRSSFVTGLALLLSGVGSYGILWLAGSFWLFVKEEAEDSHWFFLPVVLALASSFVLVENILKPFFGRVRPSEAFGLLVSETAAYGHSFPSGHAALAFAGATVLAAREPKLKSMFYILAAMIAWSRIYLGVHYPLDTITGAVLGFAIGKGALWINALVEASKNQKRRRKKS